MRERRPDWFAPVMMMALGIVLAMFPLGLFFGDAPMTWLRVLISIGVCLMGLVCILIAAYHFRVYSEACDALPGRTQEEIDYK